MKRSKHISLVLSGTLATSSWTGCGPDPTDAPPPANAVSAENTYTNNHYVSGGHGGGYYHAPYHSWFPYPYNYYSPNLGYYHGGNWTRAPNQSPIAASKPTPTATQNVGARTASSTSSGSTGGSISRGGFGSSSHGGSAAS